MKIRNSVRVVTLASILGVNLATPVKATTQCYDCRVCSGSACCPQSSSGYSSCTPNNDKTCNVGPGGCKSV